MKYYSEAVVDKIEHTFIYPSIYFTLKHVTPIETSKTVYTGIPIS